MMIVLDQDLPSIVPKKGEVVLEVKAAAVNFPDLLIVQGKYQFKVDTKHELSTAIFLPCMRSCSVHFQLHVPPPSKSMKQSTS
jgi:uncharacterized protein (UPF0254 family)